MTKLERKRMIAKARYASLKQAKAESPEAPEGKTNVADFSAHAGVEQLAESSTMGASRGVVGGNFLPESSNASSISKGFAETGRSGAPFLIEEEFEFLRSKLAPFSQSQSQQPRCPQEANPGAFAPAADACFLYGTPADGTPNFVPTELNVPSTPHREHQQLISPYPTLEEIIELAKAEQDDVEAGLKIPSHPRDCINGLDGMALSADPVLLQMDALFRNGRDPIRNPQDAEQLLRDMGVWPKWADSS
ncbi:hypothetical protein MMC22_010845 [Lobaria immixta]|nr:hypothetical protein [Lobaria immixta]